MAINVDAVYKTVLLILNQQQRGYMTPDEFNKVGTQVQLNIFEKYEDEVFQTMKGFKFPNVSFEKQSNGKGDMKDRGQKKILGIKYTPDFTGKDYIIECKGRANEQFPLRWKLFKLWCTLNNETRTLYKPQNQKDVALMIKLILDGRKQ